MNVLHTNSMHIHDLFSFRRKVLMLILACLFTYGSQAQTKELARHSVPSSVTLQSSTDAKSVNQTIKETIFQDGAIWLRLFFDNVQLGKNSTITITSKLDGASQTLNASTIQQWQNTSAYFNGNQVEITLNVPAGEKAAGISIKEISVGDPDPVAKSQCGSADDRIDSTDDAIGRLVPVGCTGWIISNGRLVTAGHCLGSSTQVVEFNVPKSNPDRSIVHPGPEDQYPILSFETPYRNNPSRENDWGVFIAGANTETGLTPIEGQVKFFNVTQDAPSGTIRITGFGTDTGIDNQTQQTHTGPLASVNNTFVSYRTDTTGGNSGSPIIDEATGLAVGVHAYGGCSRSGGSNSGERATIPDFWIAMGYGTPPPPPTEDCQGDLVPNNYSESFENGYGEWAQSNIDDIDWVINSGGTPSDATGPSSAVDGSSYLYVEASGNGEGYPNKRASLNSPCLDLSSFTTPVFSFQYHMYGSEVNTLSVEARTNNDGDWVSLFEQSGNQGDNWIGTELILTDYAGESNVQLRIVAVTGSGTNGWQSDIAIDAIAIREGLMPPPPPSACDTIINNFPYEESFEGNIGNWAQASNDDIDWTVNSGGTPSNNTGPSAASNGNSYIYVEASGDGTGFPNKTAILNSPCFDISNLPNPTLKFDYHMLGSSINSLTIQAKADEVGDWGVVFERSGSQGSNWNTATVDLSAYENTSSVQLRMIVVTGSGSEGWQSDIAVDNLSIMDGGTLPPPPVCESLNFNDFQVSSFADQDRAGDFSIGGSGESIILTNNTWKSINLDYTVTSNTVIEFDFSSTAQGEIHGVGFENDNTLTQSRIFKVHGTQSYGVTNYDNYSGGTTTYTIPVGSFYTGNMNRLVLVNDDDSGSGHNSTFSNIKIYEGTCGSFAEAESITFVSETPILGTEDEYSTANGFVIAPNPAKGIFSINLSRSVSQTTQGTIYSILGKKVAEIQLHKGLNMFSTGELSLTRGIYMITLELDDKIVTQKLIVN